MPQLGVRGALMGIDADDDAVLTDTAHDNKVYQGKEQVRTYWANVSGPFRPEHHWIGYTPAMRIKSNVTENTGTLDFECLWMNVDDNTMAHTLSPPWNWRA
jgi:hypothetical protein